MKLTFIRKIHSLSFMIWIALGTSVPLHVCAQKVLERSEKFRPAWLANRTPTPGNGTFHYQITEGEHRNLEDARHSCLLNLSTYIKRTRHISEQAVAQSALQQDNGIASESENYHFSYDIQGERVTVTSCKYDEYWEYLVYPDGKRVYRCYALYGVADKANPAFDRLPS